MIRENDMVYICSPLSAPTANEIRANMELARSYMQSEIVKARELGIPVYALLKEDPYIGVVQTPST